MSTSVDGKKSFVPTTASQAPTTAGGERKVSSQLEDEMDDSLTKKNLKHVDLENDNGMDESSSSSKGPLFQSTDAYRQLQIQKDELMDCLRKSENKYVVYNVEAKYVKYRRIIVDWMCEVGEEYQLQALTIHMAVRYLDRILCGVTVQKNRLQLVAMCCILVAAKYEERDDKVPSIDDLNECSNSAYTPALIRDMEVMVLNQLQWGLDAVTPVHFLSYYLDEGIVFEDDIVDGKAFSKRAARYVKKYADFFSDLCLQEHAFQQYPPSIISAAVIAASRRAVKIDPIWRPQLVLLTKYREKHIYSCYKHIYNHYETSFPTVPQPAVSPKAVVDFEANAFKS